MYPPDRPIPARWPVTNPATWRKPDYFSLKSLLPSNWFPSHTIAGKIFSSPLLDPAGAALNKKAQKAETDALKQINREYDQAITESQAKLAEATAVQQDTVAQAAADDRRKNMMLVFGVVVVLGIGVLLMFKK